MTAMSASESGPGSGPRLVLVSCPEGAASNLARRLVEERLAACVSRFAVQSTYRWEGEVHDEGEVLLVIKTNVSRWEALQALLAEAHPFEVPECVALDPAAVEPRYLAWLQAETAP